MASPASPSGPVSAPATQPEVSPCVILPTAVPDTWLTQIRDAVKADRPSVIWALLGSSVLAALIGAGSSISTAYVTMKASGELEIKKSQLEQSRVEDKATVDSYNGLDKSLNDLRQEFDGVVTLAQIAQSKQGKNGKLPTINLNSQFEHLGVDVGAVLAFKEDPHIDQRVWNKIDKPINQSGVAA